MIFMLSDRWGEPDPRKIAELPAYILTHWEAYFSLLEKEAGINTPPKDPAPTLQAAMPDNGFADCFRILGNG